MHETIRTIVGTCAKLVREYLVPSVPSKSRKSGAVSPILNAFTLANPISMEMNHSVSATDVPSPHPDDLLCAPKELVSWYIGDFGSVFNKVNFAPARGSVDRH